MLEFDRKKYQKEEESMETVDAGYSCYEPEISGRYTEKEMEKIYADAVDKREYPDYAGWKWDMLRSGIFMRRK